MCFIIEASKIIDLFLYIELKNSTLLKFHLNYLNFISLKPLFLEKPYRFKNSYENELSRTY